MCLKAFISTLALLITRCHCVKIADCLILAPHLENVEVGEMISDALSSFKIL